MKKLLILLPLFFTFKSFAFEPVVDERFLELSRYAGAAQAVATLCLSGEQQKSTNDQSATILRLAHSQGVNIQVELERDFGYKKAKEMIDSDGCDAPKVKTYKDEWINSSKEAINEIKPFIGSISEEKFTFNEHSSILAQYLILKKVYSNKKICSSIKMAKKWEVIANLYVNRFGESNGKKTSQKLFKIASKTANEVSNNNLSKEETASFCSIYSRSWVLDGAKDTINSINMEISKETPADVAKQDNEQTARNISMSVVRMIAAIRNQYPPEFSDKDYSKINNSILASLMNKPEIKTSEDKDAFVYSSSDGKSFNVAFFVSPTHCAKVHELLGQQYPILINWTMPTEENIKTLCSVKEPLFSLNSD